MGLGIKSNLILKSFEVKMIQWQEIKPYSKIFLSCKAARNLKPVISFKWHKNGFVSFMDKDNIIVMDKNKNTAEWYFSHYLLNRNWKNEPLYFFKSGNFKTKIDCENSVQMYSDNFLKKDKFSIKNEIIKAKIQEDGSIKGNGFDGWSIKIVKKVMKRCPTAGGHDIYFINKKTVAIGFYFGRYIHKFISFPIMLADRPISEIAKYINKNKTITKSLH